MYYHAYNVAYNHARFRGSAPRLGGLKETKMFLPHPRVKVSIVGSLRDREVACSASDRQGSDFESCVWRTVSSQSFHHPQEVLLAQFSLYVHKGGLKPDSFHFIYNRSIFAYLVRCYVRTQQTRDIAPMVGQRRRRCANINSTLGKCCNNNDSCQFKSFWQNSRPYYHGHSIMLEQVILCNIYIFIS